MNNATIAATNETRDELSELTKPPAKLEWRWIALVCMLLVISGAIRYWRDWQFQSLSRESEMPPFPLNEFPKELGSWRAFEGSEATLEPDIARIAGASDYLIRTYVDEKSGESAVVMIIYGLAYRVWPHIPDVCYPANGFKSVPPLDDIDIQIPGTTTKCGSAGSTSSSTRQNKEITGKCITRFATPANGELTWRKTGRSFAITPGCSKSKFSIKAQAPGRVKTIRQWTSFWG